MSLFIDASAIVAIVEDESDSRVLTAHLQESTKILWSPLSCWEAVSALKNNYERPIAVARERIQGFGELFNLTLVPVGGRELSIALDAYAEYGKGRHRAKLNFGDCFAYACAKTNSARLIYKGDDFAHTDLA